MTEKTRLSHWKLYLLILIFTIPVVLSWGMYEYPDYFNFHTINHGKLMQPLVHDNNFLGAVPKWQIVYAPADCTAQMAEQKMFLLHQLRRALGKDADRVGLTLLTEKMCPLNDSHDFRRLVLNGNALRATTEDHRMESKIYLVDPQGNAFMYYFEDADAMFILKDLKHILGVSQIG